MLRDASRVLKAKVRFENNYRGEIILVDDGSKDATVDEYKRIVSSISPIPGIDFKLIKLGTNSGKGRAVSEVPRIYNLDIFIFYREF